MEKEFALNEHFPYLDATTQETLQNLKTVLSIFVFVLYIMYNFTLV
jgi:hypothetical protein